MAAPPGDTNNGKPAARLDDKVSCPNHGTTSIVASSPDTFCEYLPAAVLGDKTAYGDTIIEGSCSVLINGKPAAVVGCATAHGGRITTGSSTVIIGTTPGVREAVAPEEPPATVIHPDERNYSLAFDFSEMHQAGNHNGINYSNMPIKITDSKGAHITTVWTDEHGISGRFFTNDQLEVITWVVASDHWEVIEEYEVIGKCQDDHSDS